MTSYLQSLPPYHPIQPYPPPVSCIVGYLFPDIWATRLLNEWLDRSLITDVASWGKGNQCFYYYFWFTFDQTQRTSSWVVGKFVILQLSTQVYYLLSLCSDFGRSMRLACVSCHYWQISFLVSIPVMSDCTLVNIIYFILLWRTSNSDWNWELLW